MASFEGAPVAWHVIPVTFRNTCLMHPYRGYRYCSVTYNTIFPGQGKNPTISKRAGMDGCMVMKVPLPY